MGDLRLSIFLPSPSCGQCTYILSDLRGKSPCASPGSPLCPSAGFSISSTISHFGSGLKLETGLPKGYEEASQAARPTGLPTEFRHRLT